MQAASATPLCESLDFTPKGNRAERVQTVNGPRASARNQALLQNISALHHIVDIDAAECDGKCVLGFSEYRPDDLVEQRGAGLGIASASSAKMAARRISSAEMRLPSRASS